jgi:hypothetical protein
MVWPCSRPEGKKHAMAETLKNSIALLASISERVRSMSFELDEHGTIVLREQIDAAKRAATYSRVSTGSQFANDGLIPSQPPAATLDEIVLTNLQQRVLAPEIMRLTSVE